MILEPARSWDIFFKLDYASSNLNTQDALSIIAVNPYLHNQSRRNYWGNSKFHKGT